MLKHDDKALARELRRIDRAKAGQDFDPDPPRCGTCVYFTHGGREARLAARKGQGVEQFKRCTFGNFRTSERGVCNEWRNSRGERITT